MALSGETVGKLTTCCTDCGQSMSLEVLDSAAGYYIGFYCINCGPYSRESGYYRTREIALNALKTGKYGR